ncbi:MAG TPA: hypothetical protein VFP35_02785 [Candidatus Saccharimonadales bacterium]|nr:hypothetical protein [Candidatus Saccharimonadales bacterium]
MESRKTGEQSLDIDELIRQYGGIDNIPIKYEYDTPDGRKTTTLPFGQLMRAFCPEDPATIPPDEYRKTAEDILSGRGHGRSST